MNHTPTFLACSHNVYSLHLRPYPPLENYAVLPCPISRTLPIVHTPPFASVSLNCNFPSQLCMTQRSDTSRPSTDRNGQRIVASLVSSGRRFRPHFLQNFTGRYIMYTPHFASVSLHLQLSKPTSALAYVMPRVHTSFSSPSSDFYTAIRQLLLVHYLISSFDGDTEASSFISIPRSNP